jgi:hypothetical protein
MFSAPTVGAFVLLAVIAAALVILAFLDARDHGDPG